MQNVAFIRPLCLNAAGLLLCPAAFTKYTDSVKGLEEMRKGRKTQQKGDDRRGFGDKEKNSHAWKQVRGSQ